MCVTPFITSIKLDLPNGNFTTFTSRSIADDDGFEGASPIFTSRRRLPIFDYAFNYMLEVALIADIIPFLTYTVIVGKSSVRSYPCGKLHLWALLLMPFDFALCSP